MCSNGGELFHEDWPFDKLQQQQQQQQQRHPPSIDQSCFCFPLGTKDQQTSPRCPGTVSWVEPAYSERVAKYNLYISVDPAGDLERDDTCEWGVKTCRK